ncbi:S9 family peptidase [Glaciihabitans sp. dw_435]|uniref:S9 family peptidase n=1 Tax=Glaciihabitans sp. dw_435 TaxID=2720081 RepID=UPI001BD3656B|nr:S9 family peptidase [Glaciihabitans sp. dw_435]
MTLLPPVAAQIPSTRTHHGDVVIDNYEWLREKESPAVVAHLEAENAYTDQQTDDLELLREQLFEEIKGHTLETDLSVPVRQGEWWYYSRTVEGQQYAIHCRVPISGADDWTPPVLGDAGAALPGEEIVLDDNVEAEGTEFFSLGSFDINGDGTQLLYAVDTIGDERYTLRIRDIATGEDLADEVSNTSGGALFDATGQFAFYTTVDDSWRPDTVWRHEIGTPSTDDVTVFHEPDEAFWTGIGLTRSRRYLVIEAGSSVTSEAWILDAATPTQEFRVVWPRRDGIEYSIEHAVLGGEDRLLIVHNYNAIDFEIADVPADDPTSDPRVLVPHNPGTRIESVDAFANHLVLAYRRDALSRVAVAKVDGSAEPVFEEVHFEEELFSVGAGGNPEWTQPTVRMYYGSFVTPSTVFDYSVASASLTLLKQQPVLGHYDPALLSQRREWATAEDGTRIPISLVYRHDLVVPGEVAPTLLYGYGSYEHSIDPGFSIARISLLDRGVVFAVAHVRGGGELGRAWYENGKTLTKKNTFTDFVAVARHLIDEGWTTPERLVAEGGSAGGLLMGAVANLAPDTFAGILAAVPFVDPLTSILDPSLPLTVIEWDEWGDPLHDPEVYALMKSYSPYENVAEVAYPQILAVTSINDTRVLYVEPAKWVARLREVGAPVLLRTEMSAGHGGVSGRYEAWRKKAFEYAWVLRVLGLHWSPTDV